MREVAVSDYLELRALEDERTITDLSIQSVRLTAKVCQALRSMVSLESLTFERCRLRGVHLAMIAALPNLRILRIRRSHIVLRNSVQRADGSWRSALDHLHTIGGLCVLDLSGTHFLWPIRGSGARDFHFLSRMGALTTLVLDGTFFDDGAVPAILGLSRLHSLSLRCTNVLRTTTRILEMPGLRTVDLRDTPGSQLAARAPRPGHLEVLA